MNERSPYAPPVSDVAAARERKGAPWKAVLFGLVVNIGGSMLAGFLLVIATAIYTGYTDPNGFNDNQVEKIAQIFSDPTSSIMIVGYIIGFLFSIFGGYVCSRIARHNELKLGGVLALVSSVLGLLMDGNSAASFPLELLLYSASIGGIMFGSWVGMKRNQPKVSVA
jgi:hypothetical protein